MGMEVKSYTRNYFNIYLWKSIGYIAGFASLAIVTPKTTSNPALYGIFAFCMTLNIFFQYADLGFLNAAQKYASEYYAKKDIEREIKVIGFSAFIFLVLIIPLLLLLLYFSFTPQLILKELYSGVEMKLAQNLFRILLFFAPILIIQRILQIIFSVRLEDYLTQRISIVVSLLRIISVFYFFGKGRYFLAEYFLFYNCLSFLSLFVTIRIARKKYNYDFLKLIKNLRFSREMYDKTSRMALNSLVLAISWILFYELDLVYIGALIGKNAVAYYAVGFTILTFFRDGFGTFYYPFLVRFNHFVGEEKETEIRNMYHTLLKIGLPLIVLPITCIIVFMSPLIISWVGNKYESSILAAQVLVASFLFAFITYPAGALLTAKEQLNKLYINAILPPLIFFTGIFLTLQFWGMLSFAIFKTMALFINAFILLAFSIKYLNISISRFFYIYIKPLLLALITVVLLGYILQGWITPSKAIGYLILTGSLYTVVLIAGLSVYFFTDSFTRNFCLEAFNKLRKPDKL